MIYHDLKNYIRAKQKYLSTPFKIVSGVGYAYVKGVWITDKVFGLHNSPPSYEPMPPNNEDKTRVPQSVKIRKYR